MQVMVAYLDLDHAPIILLQGIQDQGSKMIELLRWEDFSQHLPGVFDWLLLNPHNVVIDCPASLDYRSSWQE